jgi:hypothetical protein
MLLRASEVLVSVGVVRMRTRSRVSAHDDEPVLVLVVLCEIAEVCSMRERDRHQETWQR